MIICSYSRWRALSRGRVARFGATDGSENRGTGERGGATATTREPGRPRDEAARGMSTEGRRRRPSSLRAAHAPLADTEGLALLVLRESQTFGLLTTAVERAKRAERGAQSAGEVRGCGAVAVRSLVARVSRILHQSRRIRLATPSMGRAIAVRSLVARASRTLRRTEPDSSARPNVVRCGSPGVGVGRTVRQEEHTTL
jgi:hypothetical protein